MALRRNKKGEHSFNKEKAINPSNHAQNLPQILLSFSIVLIIMTVSVIMEAQNLQRTQKGEN